MGPTKVERGMVHERRELEQFITRKWREIVRQIRSGESHVSGGAPGRETERRRKQSI